MGSPKRVGTTAVKFKGSLTDDETLDASVKFKSTNPNHHVEVEWVEINDLYIDPEIQRGVEATEVKAIAARFNPAALGTVTVAVFESSGGGKVFSLLDGQQRVTACKQVGYTQKVRALVHYGLSKPEAAQLFLDLNFRRSVTALRQFRAQLTAQDPTAIGIMEILDELEIPFGGLKGFNAVRSAQKIYEQKPIQGVVDGPDGKERLKWALRIVKETYDTEGRGGVYNGHVIEGFALLYGHFAKYIDEDRLKAKLTSLAGGINALIGQGRTNASINPTWHISYAIGQAIKNFYNRYKRSNPQYPTKLADIPRRRLTSKAVVVPVVDTDETEEELD